MLNYRVCLAPLRYGAGLKGKVVDSWWHGLVVSTTEIGAEGMTADGDLHLHENDNNNTWGGIYYSNGGNIDTLAQNAVQLYENESLWTAYQQNGFDLLKKLYNREENLNTIHKAIDNALENMESRRNSDFIGQMLWMQQCRSTEYFSRFIELKESMKQDEQQ